MTAADGPNDEDGAASGVAPDAVMPAGFDLGGVMAAAQGMQQRMAEAAAEIAATELVGSSGAGKVSVTVNGAWEFRSVHIDPDVIDRDDPEMLEDLVLAALRDVASRVFAANEAANPMAGLDLGGLSGLFGGA